MQKGILLTGMATGFLSGMQGLTGANLLTAARLLLNGKVIVQHETVQCINPPNGWLQNCNSTLIPSQEITVRKK